MLRFAGFEFDPLRSEVRVIGGAPVRLRPKALDLLRQFLANPGRVLSKQELMAAVWPNIYVGDDSLFQCIKELRAALGDDQRQLIKVSSGRGYLFDTSVETAPILPDATIPLALDALPDPAQPTTRNPAVWTIIAGLAAVVLVLTAIYAQQSPAASARTISISVTATPGAPTVVERMASRVTEAVASGLAGASDLRVIDPASGNTKADLVATGLLDEDHNSWTLRARMTDPVSGTVLWTEAVTVDMAETVDAVGDPLAAKFGHGLAYAINDISKQRHPDEISDAGRTARAAIEQASASISRTDPNRFAAAQIMLENTLTADPENVDLLVALADLQIRGLQMVWYPPAEASAIRDKAQSLLAEALRSRPNDLLAHLAYCRFLNLTNQFIQSLVACANALTYDPWNGVALYHIGLAQLQLGRFEDAVATFKKADTYDTPETSRWTWKLGLGWAYMLMNRPGDALPWITQSIAVTPASGRSHFLLAAAYQALGRYDDAKSAIAMGLQLRPGSTALNIRIPATNSSATFLAATDRLHELMVAAGLPKS